MPPYVPPHAPPAACPPKCRYEFNHAADQGMAGRPCDKWLSSVGWCDDETGGWGADFQAKYPNIEFTDCRACRA
jgi:hypothetical protein